MFKQEIINSIISSAIMNDEGGWKLTYASETDKSKWTYAGITREAWGKDELPKDNQEVIEWYQKNYFDKIFTASLAQKFYDENCISIADATAMFSCAINIGLKAFIKLIQNIGKIGQDGIIGSETEDIIAGILLGEFEWAEFLQAWRQYYVQISLHSIETYYVDKTNHIKLWLNLPGWMNRVHRYE